MATSNFKIKTAQPSRLPIKQLKGKSFAALSKKAHRVLADFNKILKSVPHPESVFTFLAVDEARSSVEHATASYLMILRPELYPKNRKIPAIRHYLDALAYARKYARRAKRWSDSFLLEIHRRVKKGIRADRGRFRNRQNWIGPEGGSIEEGRYFPPKASQVSGYMKNLQAYLNHPEKDKLVQWAVYFAQFLAIHPFMDGNGRVVRVLTPVFLSQKKLLSYPLFYISGYFKRHYGAYYDKLFDISNKDDWKGWIEFFLKGIIEEGERNCKKALKLARLYKKWAGVLSKDLPPQLARKTLDFIFENPVFIQHQFRSRCRCSSAAQKKIFKDLKIQKTRRKMVCQPILSLF